MINKMDVLLNLKKILGLDPLSEEEELDSKLNLIIGTVEKRLKILLGGIEIPEELDYIVLNVAVIRFNRIGSEGLSSHSVAGESLSWSDNDFAEYMSDIQLYKDSKNADSHKGGILWL